MLSNERAAELRYRYCSWETMHGSERIQLTFEAKKKKDGLLVTLQKGLITSKKF